jgi:hypothetical protein
VEIIARSRPLGKMAVSEHRQFADVAALVRSRGLLAARGQDNGEQNERAQAGCNPDFRPPHITGVPHV